MTTLITLLFTLFIVCALFYLFVRLKTPYYRVDKQRMVRILEMVLTGQATDNDWQMTFSMTIRHSPVLESIRLECVDIEEQYYIGDQRPPYLFSHDGLTELKKILHKLKNVDNP